MNDKIRHTQKGFTYFWPMRKLLLAAFILVFLLDACAPKVSQTGRATYYAASFDGKRTASGERFRNSAQTAAHRTLTFGTKLKVTNLSNGKKVKVVVNDRGPYSRGYMLDLSQKAARKIGMMQSGTARVKIQYRKKKR